MPKLRCALILALALAASAGSAAGAQAPHISKPRPAPRNTPNMPSLPPAVIDNTLAIGGNDIKARQVETRMTVEVMVNGRGPYRFLVDSGADTSVVGLRLAQDLQLPLGTPVMLNGMTARNIVDRVKVGELSLGQTTISNLEVPALKEQDLGGDGMLGIDALVKQRLMIDFETLLIKVEDAARCRSTVCRRRDRDHRAAPARPADPDRSARRRPAARSGDRHRVGNHDRQSRAARQAACATIATSSGPSPTTGVTGKTVDLEMAVIGELQPRPGNLAQRAHGLCRRAAVQGVRHAEGAFAAARYRHSGNVPPRLARLSRPQGPLPARHCGSTGVELTTSPAPTLSPPVDHRRFGLPELRLRAPADRLVSLRFTYGEPSALPPFSREHAARSHR